MKRRRATQEDMDEWAARALDMLDHPDRYPEDLVVIKFDTDVFHSIFSPERVRMIRFLREHGPVESVSELADLIDRDVTRVSRDLKILEDAHLVERERVGKFKTVRAPQKTIWVV